MTRRILVTGLIPFDSGKTQFALGLIRELLDDGELVKYFKPVSGHNYWYRYPHTKKCIERNELFSFDAWKAQSTLNSDIDIKIMNPVHRLYVPAKLENPGRNILSTFALAGWDSVFVIERFSHPSQTGIISDTLVAESMVENSSTLITTEEVDSLTTGTNRKLVASLQEVQQYEAEVFEMVVSSSFKHIEEGAETVIIESLNDAVWPWSGLEYVDEVFLVGPGQVFSYDPEKFRKAAFFTQRAPEPIRSVTFGRISDLVRPKSRVEIPAK